MRVLLTLAIVITAGLAEHYEGFKVYQLLPKNKEQLQLIKLFTEAEDYDVWSPIRQGGTFDVMVKPRAQTEFSYFLQSAGIEYTILLHNVESTIQNQKRQQLRTPKGEISFNKYHSYSEIQAYLHELAKKYSHVSLENIGKSYEGRDLNVIKISSNPSSKNPIIFVDGGIHAREWISPATVLYLIHQLAENPNASNLFNKVDWHIIPTLNPDGYSYTFTKDRMWRKTRSPNYPCIGVDPNRNFGFHWGGPGSGTRPCGEDYRGKTAFSEVETQALRDYILKIKEDVKLYLTFHSYGNYLLYPWSYTSEYPENAKELQALGDDVAESIKGVSGTKYKVGSSTNVLYATAGSSDDWVKGEAGVELAYTIELPGKGSGFLLPPSQILPVVKETWQGIVKFHEYIEWKYGVA